MVGIHSDAMGDVCRVCDIHLPFVWRVLQCVYAERSQNKPVLGGGQAVLLHGRGVGLLRVRSHPQMEEQRRGIRAGLVYIRDIDMAVLGGGRSVRGRGGHVVSAGGRGICRVGREERAGERDDLHRRENHAGTGEEKMIDMLIGDGEAPNPFILAIIATVLSVLFLGGCQ